MTASEDVACMLFPQDGQPLQYSQTIVLLDGNTAALGKRFMHHLNFVFEASVSVHP